MSVSPSFRDLIRGHLTNSRTRAKKITVTPSKMDSQDQDLFSKSTPQKIRDFVNLWTVRGDGILPKEIKKISTWSYCNEDFSKYGVGVYLFFDFLKFLTLTMGIATLISTIPLGFNLSGHNIQKGEARFHLERTTIANITQSDWQKYAYIATLIADLSYSFFVSGMLIYYQKTLRNKVKLAKSRHPLPSHYSLEVRNIPEETTEIELINFFSSFGGVVECKVSYFFQ